MAVGRYMTIACATFALCWASESFDNILSDVTPCEEACTKSYSPHTNPSGSDNTACNRGCRFYMINEFIAEDHSDPGPGTGDKDSASSLLTNCFEACIEAYSETSPNTASCKHGCEGQQTLSKVKKDSDEGEEQPTMHLLSPIMQVRSVYSKFIGTLHIVRSSLVTLFISDNNSLVAVESEPEVLMEIVPEEDLQEEPAALNGLPQMRQMPYEENVGDASVVKCFSRRLGVPPYLLVASVLALVLFTFYVMFAVCNTSSPPKSKTDGLSVQSDPLPMPIKLVRPEELTKLSLTEEDDLQAPPLPSKVKLPDSVI